MNPKVYWKFESDQPKLRFIWNWKVEFGLNETNNFLRTDADWIPFGNFRQGNSFAIYINNSNVNSLDKKFLHMLQKAKYIYNKNVDFCLEGWRILIKRHSSNNNLLCISRAGLKIAFNLTASSRCRLHKYRCSV